MIEVQPKLTADEAIQRIAADIRAYPQALDRSEEHIRLYSLRDALIPREEIEALWAERYAEIALAGKAKLARVGARSDALRPKIEEVRNDPNLGALFKKSEKKADAPTYRRIAISDHVVNRDVSSFLPATQPKADEAREDTRELNLEGPQSVPIGFRQSLTIAPAVADEGVLCLDPAAPFDNAQKLVSLRAWHPGERIRTWQFWQKSFWQWSGTHWQEVDDDTVRASVWHELNGAEKVLKGGKRARFEPKMNDVNAMVDALKGRREPPDVRGKRNAWMVWRGQTRRRFTRVGGV
jgi:hypothetical protein